MFVLQVIYRNCRSSCVQSPLEFLDVFSSAQMRCGVAAVSPGAALTSGMVSCQHVGAFHVYVGHLLRLKQLKQLQSHPEPEPDAVSSGRGPDHGPSIMFLCGLFLQR